MEIRGIREYQNLILRYDKNSNKFLDITDKVIYLKENKDNFFIAFIGNKSYNFNKKNIKVSVNPTNIKFNRNYVYLNNKKLRNVSKILKFENLGFKIFYNDNKTLYLKNIDIRENRIDINYFDLSINSGNNVFDYYKTLAKYAADISQDDLSTESLLYSLYGKINRVNVYSVLNAYTNKYSKKIPFDINKIIYPFRTNLSQMTAIKNAFSNEISVISGPPGTGKTQVILNIICNAVINKKTVAVISNNNTAVENVYEKMQEQGLDYIIAYLGNIDNVEKFFSKRIKLEEKIKSIHFEQEGYASLNNIKEKLEKLYQYLNELTILKQRHYDLNEEFRHYKENHSFIDYSNLIKRGYDYNTYLNIKYYLLSIKKLNFFTKLKLRFKYKIKKLNYNLINEFIVYLEYQFYYKKLEELENKIKELEDYIDSNNLNTLNKKLNQKSRNLLNEYLFNKYSRLYEFSINKDNYRQYFNQFIDRYPVVLSTTHSLLRNIEYGYKFDLVIIDEASQSDILTSLLTMNVATQMVIVGDPKQLSQIDNTELYDFSEKLANHYQIQSYYRYKDNSILQSVLSLPINIPCTILKEHYRCDSRIIEFCNRKFYNNELIICTNTSDNDSLFIVHTVPGNHARKNPNGSGYYNDREAQEILEIIRNSESKDIGIITPFRAQAEHIKKIIDLDYLEVEVDTIHKYQGRQKEIVIISTVVNDLNYERDSFITDFVTNRQLLNVAISRAVKKLYLVVSNKVYNSSNNTISQFIDYIKYYSKETIKEGSITSIFDELYNVQNRVLKESPLYKYVDSYAEAIVLKKLNKILNDYPDYKIHLHYRLSDLIKKYDGFTNDEIRYITHPKTHVDFVVFDKITYKPVLCIEVDGTKYHDYAPRQIRNDKIKTRILEANNINLLRLRTNESEELKKIKRYLT